MYRPASRAGKVKALKESAALFNFLQTNGITSMQQLHEKISAMNSRYYELRGEIVSTERRIATLEERLSMWEQYEKYKAVHKQYRAVKSEQKEEFREAHMQELTLFDAANHFVKELKAGGESITPKAWNAEKNRLTAQKEQKYAEMKAMREELKAAEQLKKTADRLAKEEQEQAKHRETER